MKSSSLVKPRSKMVTKSEYSAPALEKGLDIVELLAVAGEALTAREIGDRLGRSKNEIFRMVFVLLERGYLYRDPTTDKLSLSNRLFELGMRTPRTRGLTEIALPAMQQLSNLLGYSSHLVVINRGETVVVASAVGRSDINFSLQLGYRRPAVDAASGQAIIAFQSPDERSRLIKESFAISQLKTGKRVLASILDQIATEGSVVSDSHDVVGVTDICAPILDKEGHAIASIVIPCLRKVTTAPRHGEVRSALVACCRSIGGNLI